MSPNKTPKVDETLVEQLCSIASVSRVVATNLLEACGNDLEMAVNMHMEGVLTESDEGVGGNMCADKPHSVRAPIPQKQEVLVEGPDQLSYSFRGRTRIARSVFDRFRDFQAEARHQEEELMGESSSFTFVDESNSQRKKMRTLEDLFRPPLDIMFKGNFQAARDSGIARNKWLLVNVQNSTEFACQVLNRDVWSNAAVKLIVQEHFIFWQIYHDSEEGVRYMNFYPVTDWPYIAILDPRTGECIITWKKMDAVSFCDVITEFLTRYSTLDDGCRLNSAAVGASVPPVKKIKTTESIIEADEDAQIAAAIKASLEEGDSHNTVLTSPESDRDSEDSDILETFDSDSDNVDYSLDGKGPQACSEIDSTDKNCVTHSIQMKADQSDVSNGDVMEDEDSEDEVYEEKERWRAYLGKESDCKSKLILRLPDGTRDVIEMPNTSKLKALVLYVASKGFSNETYELITNFPKRELTTFDCNVTLKALGLFPQETIFVQKR